ncbi:9216_t:CDS:2, partial [Acaulospora morrowiae]
DGDVGKRRDKKKALKWRKKHPSKQVHHQSGGGTINGTVNKKDQKRTTDKEGAPREVLQQNANNREFQDLVDTITLFPITTKQIYLKNTLLHGVAELMSIKKKFSQKTFTLEALDPVDMLSQSERHLLKETWKSFETLSEK